MADFDTAEMTADFNEMLSGLAQSAVSFSSKRKPGVQTVSACVGEVGSATEGSEEGLFGDDALSLTVLASAFSAGWIPTSGDVVEVDGVKYRVKTPRHVPGDVVWTFDCEAISK